MDKSVMKKAVIISSSGPRRVTTEDGKERADNVKERDNKRASATEGVEKSSSQNVKVSKPESPPDSPPTAKKSKAGLLDGVATKIKKVKHFEILLVAVFAVAVVLIFFGTGWFGGTSTDSGSDDDYISASDYCAQTEARLSRILSSVKGAGDVEVMINFESTPERILAYIISVNANKSAGGDANYNETDNRTETPQILNVNGKQVPLVLKELAPKVTGIIIVSQGADNIKTKVDLINAAAILLDISRENIIVLTMNKAAR